ncbi:MAG: hypothetical protein ACP5GX_11795, partial [Anaerolineae bacterium]
VVVRWSGGAVGGRYGVRFRHQDESNYYAFYLGNDGRCEITKRVNGEKIHLIEGFSNAIDRMGGENNIRVEAQGCWFTFFVNDQYVTSLHDVDHRLGDVVFYAHAPQGADFFEASFDNLQVMRFR